MNKSYTEYLDCIYTFLSQNNQRLISLLDKWYGLTNFTFLLLYNIFKL